MTLSRRSLITGLISLVAAPAIVRVSSLMPVKVVDWNVSPIFYQDRMAWVSPVDPQTVEFSSVLPPEMQALLQKRIDAAYGLLRRSIIANVEEDLYNTRRSGPFDDWPA